MTRTNIRRAGRWGALLVIAAAFALGLAACGGGGSSTTRGSIEDQLGFDQAGIAERQSRVEAAIGECMKAQGFEYVPIDPLAQRAAVTGSARLSDEDFLQQFGYGISTLYGRASAQADPNERIRESLSDADRAAYDRALWGENVGATFAEANDSGDFTRLGGCTKQATEQVFGGVAVLTGLVSKLDDLDERIAQDQRMVRATEQWSQCMADAGFKYEEPDDIDGAILDKFKAIAGSSVEPGATSASDGNTVVAVDQAALQALQREEVETARADAACEAKYITPVEDVVRPEYEATFRQENAQLLTQVPKAGG